MSGKYSFCLPPSDRTVRLGHWCAESKYFPPMSNIQLKYHLHLEAFLTYDPVTCYLFYVSLIT